MSIHFKTSLLAASLLMVAPALAPQARAQAVSVPSNDQPQSAASAASKAAHSDIDQPNNRLPTNPHTVAEQPDQPPPTSPGHMQSTSQTGSVPSDQSNVKNVGTSHHRSGHKHRGMKHTSPDSTSSDGSPQ
ncbi:hypothetical protein [Gluconobacter morbifer]|nr:hypothetical protein [Gluconobacter morbifer]